MRKYQRLIFLALLLLTCSSTLLGKAKNLVQNIKRQTNNEDINATPKLPMYLGSSYNLINGNPKSQYGLDPGFVHPVFSYEYTKQQTTQDGKYLIPNGVSSHKMSSCSFTTDINAFRGTQSYQTDLHKIATLTESFGGSFVSAAFSFSRSWQKIQNSTIQDKTTITHATAQCQTYQLIIDMFKMPPLTDDFTTGAVQSYKKKDWTQFIQEFGSHFVHQIIVGGRATQQTVYSFESVSKLESLEVDINITAKAAFAKFLSDASFDWEKHDRQIQYSQRMSTMRSQQYIGGAPPRTGNIYDWQEKIIDSPMPIKYKLLPLTALFEKVSSLQFDSKKATTDFNQALQDYCTRLHCKPPTPDLPKPDPATVLTTKTDQFGSDGGQPFQSIYNSTTLDLKRIHIRSGSMIDNLQLFLSDGVTQLYTPAVGGLGGGPSIWTVPDNQFVTQIQYRSGTRIDSLTFITNKGNKSPRWGGNGGSYHLVNFPDGYRIIGFYGVYGNTVYRLGFILGKTMYPVKNMSSAQIIKIQLQ